MKQTDRSTSSFNDAAGVMRAVELVLGIATLSWRVWMAVKQYQQSKALEANQHLIARGVGEVQAVRDDLKKRVEMPGE